jgi:hypothetical protein
MARRIERRGKHSEKNSRHSDPKEKGHIFISSSIPSPPFAGPRPRRPSKTHGSQAKFRPEQRH